MKVISGLVLLILLNSPSAFSREMNNNAFQKIANDTIPVKNDTSFVDEKGEVKVFEKVEVEAEFPGGAAAWREFIITNLNSSIPADKGAPVGQYTVEVQFIVDKAGAITCIKALTKFGYGMEAEVVRMIKRSPKWIPAQQEGRFVNAYRKQPITFVVEETKKRRKSRD